MTAFISTTNAFFFVMTLKVLPEPEPNALQIPLDHTEDCRGSVFWDASHSAIRPIPCVHWHVPLSVLMLYPHWRWVGVMSGLWGWQAWVFPSVACVTLLLKVGSYCPPIKSQVRGQLHRKETLPLFKCPQLGGGGTSVQKQTAPPHNWLSGS